VKRWQACLIQRTITNRAGFAVTFEKAYLGKRAKEFGFQLTPFEPATVSVS
jgi:hypothetical protein